MQQPTIGRIVHYTNLGDADGKFPPETQPALIVRVNATPEPQDIGAWIFYPGGFFYMASIPYSETPKRGHWNWPPRV